jgi:hypothetical protein
MGESRRRESACIVAAVATLCAILFFLKADYTRRRWTPLLDNGTCNTVYDGVGVRFTFLYHIKSVSAVKGRSTPM